MAISAAMSLALVAILALVREPANWPPLEQPPRQGEAVAIDSAGSVRHAPAATARLIREPQNTWSNLAFVVGGTHLIVAGRLRVVRWAGVALIAVGVGSFLYHASASRTLRNLDVGAMYGLFLFAAALAAMAWSDGWRRFAEAKTVIIAVVVALMATALTWGRNLAVMGIKPFALDTVTGVTAAVLIGALSRGASRARTFGAWVRLMAVVGIFALAVLCQIGDRPGGWLFAPAAAVQAHALWHLFAAIAFVAAVRLIEREALS